MDRWFIDDAAETRELLRLANKMKVRL